MLLRKGFSCLVLLSLVSKLSSICTRCHIDFRASNVTGHLTLENRSLVGYGISTLQAEHFLECFDACIEDCRCMSINWEKSPKQGVGHQCQLNSENKDTDVSALVEKPGHSYHDIEETVSDKLHELQYVLSSEVFMPSTGKFH